MSKHQDLFNSGNFTNGMYRTPLGLIDTYEEYIKEKKRLQTMKRETSHPRVYDRLLSSLDEFKNYKADEHKKYIATINKVMKEKNLPTDMRKSVFDKFLGNGLKGATKKKYKKRK